MLKNKIHSLNFLAGDTPDQQAGSCEFNNLDESHVIKGSRPFLTFTGNARRAQVSAGSLKIAAGLADVPVQCS